MKKTLSLLFLFFLVSQSLYAETHGDADTLFNWAENQYSKLFSPADQPSQTFESWYFRYYPDTDNYVGVNIDGDVYVFGDIFGGLWYIDTLQSLLSNVWTGLTCPPENAAPLDSAGPGDSFITYVPSQLGNVAIRVSVPAQARYLDHTQVVVNVATFFTTTKPFYTDLDVTPVGLIHISYIWPGSEDPQTGACSEGEFDHGGATSISTLRDVIRYALGDLADIEGQRISDRITGMTPGDVGLWAFSHPGIAAVNVLTHHADELQDVAWFVGRENPTQDQHSAVELGHFSDTGERVLNPLYQYQRDYRPGMLELDFSSARWAGDYVEPGHEESVGRAYFDLDGDGFDLDADYVLSYRIPKMWDKRYLSRSLTQALRNNGLSEAQWPQDLATPEEAEEAWAFRNSIDRYALLSGSDLRVMLVFAQTQHVQPLPDAASIHSAYDGFSDAGIWVRINPDKAYAEWAFGGPFPDFPDHDAQSEPTDWATAGAEWGYPRYSDTPPASSGETVGWAAVAEMADRQELGRWESNLGTVLIPGFPGPQP